MNDSKDYIYIEKILAGDSNAYKHLVDKYKRMAYTVALKIMRNIEDAEDTTQESFIKAYQQIHTFKNESKFSTWLYTIVYRTAIFNLRKKQIITQQINEGITEDYISDSGNVNDNELLEQENIKLVKKAINNLPEIESLLITLFYINENSITEIKEITGLSKSNIKVKLYRARKKMKKELKEIIETKMIN